MVVCTTKLRGNCEIESYALSFWGTGEVCKEKRLLEERKPSEQRNWYALTNTRRAMGRFYTLILDVKI